MRWILKTFTDKVGNPSGRELTAFVSMLVLLATWAAYTWFGRPVNDTLATIFAAFVTAAIVGYSLESPGPPPPPAAI